ncbi:MAG TPA: PilN domain-containing protein [Candidatus Paceibacterota bacterium]|jgi:hypothetical protein|nr:PilN domain-containing protein [Candidatus Paceibacterota bacterium]
MNLLPPVSQKIIRKEVRARFLLTLALVLIGTAALSALALAPAEVALVYFSPPPAQTAQGDVNPAQDGAAIVHTKALLTAVQSLTATSSLTAISEALAQLAAGVSVNDISYTPARYALSIAGQAQTPDQVNALRQALQKDPLFNNVSVPVAALLGSQGGGFTITMNTAH